MPSQFLKIHSLFQLQDPDPQWFGSPRSWPCSNEITKINPFHAGLILSSKSELYLRGFNLEPIKTSVGDQDPQDSHVFGPPEVRIRILPSSEIILAKQDFNTKF
jgi:hypothetical protein